MDERPPSSPYRGGRHLEAITHNADLTRGEKVLLHAVASYLNYKLPFPGQRVEIPLPVLVQRTGYVRRQVIRLVKACQAKGYLGCLKRKDPRCPKLNLKNVYWLTRLLFDHYQTLMSERAASKDNRSIKHDFDGEGVVTSCHQGSDTVSLGWCQGVTGSSSSSPKPSPYYKGRASYVGRPKRRFNDVPPPEAFGTDMNTAVIWSPAEEPDSKEEGRPTVDVAAAIREAIAGLERPR